METKGPHKDTQELRLGAFRWMNRWLKDDKGEVTERDVPKLTPQQLKVFERLPGDAINVAIHESFVKTARIEQPHAPTVTREWWKGRAPELMDELRTRVFRGWPEKPPALNARLAQDVKHNGLRLRAYDFVSEEEVELRLWLMTADKVEKPTLVVLNALDEEGWREWVADLGPAFKEALQLPAEPKLEAARFDQNVKTLQFHRWAFAEVAPRGVGPTRWSEVSPFDG